MGFHKRYLNEKRLREVYCKGGRKAIFLLYSTADAIIAEDKFSSEITDLFSKRLEEKELSRALAAAFKCHEFEDFILRRLAAINIVEEVGLEDAMVMFPEDASFLRENARNSSREVQEALLKQL